MLISPKKEYRLYEALIGLIVWGILILAIVFSFFAPLWAIIFIIIFDTYWLFKVMYFSVNLVLAWINYKKSCAMDWKKKMLSISSWENKLHIIVLPTYKEDVSVIEHTLETLAKSSYPMQKCVIVLAGEEKDKEHFENAMSVIRAKFSETFADILMTIHPFGIEGELPGKGSNLHFVGPFLKEYADKNEIAYRDVIVSAFDVDTVVHPEYFSCLTYTYCTHPNPTRSSYQPIPLYNNTMWDVPSVVRIMAFGTTFWMMSEVTRPKRLWTFSSHSMSLKALVETGFWQKNIVSEDSRIFLQMFIRYDGNYEVTPIYVPVSMDTVSGKSFFESIKNIYKQQRRWAWGAENLPFMLWHFRRNPRIAWQKKFRLIFNYIEGMCSWSLAALLILVLGRLPLWIGSSSYTESLIFHNAPFVLEKLMGFAMLGLFLSAGLSFTLLPRGSEKTTWKSYVSFGLHWLTLPITLLVLGSFPALDSQTRLMIGSYLGFNVTIKSKR